jgi:hypothetical protein
VCRPNGPGAERRDGCGIRHLKSVSPRTVPVCPFELEYLSCSTSSQRIIVDVVGNRPPGQRSRPAAALVVLVAVTATVGILIAVLQRPPTHAPIRPTAIPTSIPTPTPDATQTPLSVDLSGTWEGECTGPLSANSFCAVTWTQTGNALNGTIMWSSSPDGLHISGNVTGSTISFGAARVVTFTGTLSGATMSGSYKDIANGKTGSWSVTLNT